MNIKRLIIKVKWFPSLLFNKIKLKFKKAQYGTKLVTYGNIFIRGKGKIIIGNNVTITSCRETNPIGGDIKSILYAKDKSVIVIGNNCGISNSAIVALEKVVIEDDVMIGGSCKIYDNDFHPIYYEERMQNPIGNVKSSPVLIKKGAFIGAGSIILKGVIVGEKSVVGAGSVVTKNIPDEEVWAGNPARFIKKLNLKMKEK